MSSFIVDFREFMLQYNVIGVMVGFACAVTTVALIKSFVADIFIPTIYIVLGKWIIQHLSSKAYSKFSELFESPINIDNFIKEFVTWILIIISIYFIIKYLVSITILGNQNVSEKKQPVPSNVLTKPMPMPVTPSSSPYVVKKPTIQEENNANSAKYYNEQFYM